MGRCLLTRYPTEQRFNQRVIQQETSHELRIHLNVPYVAGFSKSITAVLVLPTTGRGVGTPDITTSGQEGDPRSQKFFCRKFVLREKAASLKSNSTV